MAKKEPKAEASTELALFGVAVNYEDSDHNHINTTTADNPLLVLTHPDVREKLFDQIKAEVDAFVPDLSTDTGRKAVASLAYKVARTKTAIDKAGLKATEDARALIASVNRERNVVSSQLEILQARARDPLTRWEAAETKRLEEITRKMSEVRAAGEIALEDTSADIVERVTALKKLQAELETPAVEIVEYWGEFLPVYTGALQGSLAALDAAYTRIKREEDDRAELDRLRKAEQERQAQAEEAERQRVQRENAERAQAEAEARESQRKALEAEQAQLAEQREREAAERAAEEARQEEARKAAEAQAERDRQHQAELDAQRRETERLQREADERKQAEEKAANEARQREADREHRGKVMGEAKLALMTVPGVSEDAAKAIVLLIKAGEVPHVSIAF